MYLQLQENPSLELFKSPVFASKIAEDREGEYSGLVAKRLVTSENACGLQRSVRQSGVRGGMVGEVEVTF